MNSVPENPLYPTIHPKFDAIIKAIGSYQIEVKTIAAKYKTLIMEAQGYYDDASNSDDTGYAEFLRHQGTLKALQAHAVFSILYEEYSKDF